MSTENADMATGATAEEIDAAFDRGEDMRRYFDFEHGELRQPAVVKEVRTYRKVNVDFPADMVDALDAYAARIGIGRQSLVKAWIWGAAAGGAGARRAARRGAGFRGGAQVGGSSRLHCPYTRGVCNDEGGIMADQRSWESSWVPSPTCPPWRRAPSSSRSWACRTSWSLPARTATRKRSTSGPAPRPTAASG